MRIMDLMGIMGVMGITNMIAQKSLIKQILRKSFRVRSDTLVTHLSLKRLRAHGSTPSVSDIFFRILERMGDDDDDEDQSDSDWVTELQPLDGRIIK